MKRFRIVLALCCLVFAASFPVFAATLTGGRDAKRLRESADQGNDEARKLLEGCR